MRFFVCFAAGGPLICHPLPNFAFGKATFRLATLSGYHGYCALGLYSRRAWLPLAGKILGSRARHAAAARGTGRSRERFSARARRAAAARVIGRVACTATLPILL